MKSTRFALTFGLGLALLPALVWMLSSSLVPARAYKDETVTPAPTGDRSALPHTVQNPPLKDHISDGRSQTLPGVNVLGFSSAGIANGDFENGRDGSWQEYSSHGWDVITEMPTLPVPAHSGNWAAWLGGDYDDISFIAQSLNIPDGNPKLKYWEWVGSEDNCGYDFARVRINSTTVQTIDLCVDNANSGWVERIIDLSSYAGQTISLHFRVETDTSLNSNYFVDDLTVDTTAPPATDSYTYLPVSLANFWAGFFDNFSDPNSGWYTGDTATWKYGYLNGEYQILLKNPQWGGGVTPDLVLPSDYRIEVDARQAVSGESTYALLFGTRWVGDTSETYQFLIDPASQHYLLNKRNLDGSWPLLIDWTYNSAIHQGMGTNHLRVDRIGTAIYLYINGTLVTTFYDSSFTSPGRDAGVKVYSYDSAPVDVRFDNFSATRP